MIKLFLSTTANSCVLLAVRMEHAINAPLCDFDKEINVVLLKKFELVKNRKNVMSSVN